MERKTNLLAIKENNYAVMKVYSGLSEKDVPIYLAGKGRKGRKVVCHMKSRKEEKKGEGKAPYYLY